MFQAGTRRDSAGRLVTAGGRVLTVVGFDRGSVYAAAETIRFDGKQFRRDIGTDLEPSPPGPPLPVGEGEKITRGEGEALALAPDPWPLTPASERR